MELTLNVLMFLILECPFYAQNWLKRGKKDLSHKVLNIEPQHLAWKTRTDLSMQTFLRFWPNLCLDVLIKLFKKERNKLSWECHTRNLSWVGQIKLLVQNEIDFQNISWAQKLGSNFKQRKNKLQRNMASTYFFWS